MAIIPRINPEVRDLAGLPGVRNRADFGDGGASQIMQQTRSIAQGLGAVAQYQQQEADKTDVVATMGGKRQVSDWIMAQEDPNNPDAITNTRGRDALKLTDTKLPEFDKRMGEIEATLPSQRAKDQFRLHAATEREQFQRRLTSYAVGQNEQYQNEERKSYETSATVNTANAYLTGDEQGATRLREDLLNTIYADAAAQGQPATMARLRVQAAESDIHATIINRLLVTDPIKAQTYLDAHGDAILPDTRTRLMDQVKTYADDAHDEAIADAVFSVGSSNVQGTLDALGNQYGFSTTSTTRTQAENAAVGGVANSQHLTGTARDYSVKGKTPEQVAAFASALHAQGFEVITAPHGTGPHVHAELPKGGARQGPPATLGEALARLPEEADPKRRKAQEMKLRSRWAVMEADKADQVRAVGESVNLAIETGDTSLSLRQVLGGNFEAMAKAGDIPALERRWADRKAGISEQSNPIVLDGVNQTLYLASKGVKDAQENLRSLNPYATELQLDSADRQRLAKAQLDFLSGDPKRVQKAATEAEINTTIVQYRRTSLGLTDDAIKKDPAKMAQAVAFDQSMRTWRAQFTQDNGREPNYLELRKQADILTLGTVKVKGEVPGMLWGTNTVEKAIPADMQALIVDALQTEGLPITKETVAKRWADYLNQKQAK